MDKLDIKRMGKKYLPPSKRPQLPQRELGAIAFDEMMPMFHHASSTPTAQQLMEPPVEPGNGTMMDQTPYLTIKDLPDDWLQLMMAEAQRGRTTTSFMRALGLTKAGFETLLATSPAFAEAYERCLLYACEWWEDTGRGLATGDIRGNGSVWMANMSNKWGWTSKAETTQQVKQQVVVQDDLSDEELEAELKRRGLPIHLLEE